MVHATLAQQSITQKQTRDNFATFQMPNSCQKHTAIGAALEQQLQLELREGERERGGREKAILAVFKLVFQFDLLSHCKEAADVAEAAFSSVKT